MLPKQSDMVEYNQCQATLKTLYELGIEGRVEEFTAYRILMLLHGRNRSGKCRLVSISVVPAICDGSRRFSVAQN